MDISNLKSFGLIYYSAISTRNGDSVFLSPIINLQEFTSANSFSVAEDTAVNSTVFTVSATDADPDDVISYSLTDNTNTFSIDSSTGVITLIQSLDYETTASYSIVVNALVANEPTVSQTITVTVTNIAEGFEYDAANDKITVASEENIISFADLMALIMWIISPMPPQMETIVLLLQSIESWVTKAIYFRLMEL